jgi:hypothetical protein
MDGTYPVEDHEAEVEVDGAGGGVLDGHGAGVPTEAVLLLVHGHAHAAAAAAAPGQLVRRRQAAHAGADHRHSHPGRPLPHQPNLSRPAGRIGFSLSRARWPSPSCCDGFCGVVAGQLASRRADCRGQVCGSRTHRTTASSYSTATCLDVIGGLIRETFSPLLEWMRPVVGCCVCCGPFRFRNGRESCQRCSKTHFFSFHILFIYFVC